MLKKFVSAMLLVLPLTSWGWVSGYYAGGGVGADAVNYGYNTYTKQAPDQQAFSVLSQTNNAAQGIFGTAFGGYHFVRESFYLAAEANINVSSAMFKTTNSEFDHPAMQATSTRLKILPNWGLSLVPGWLLWRDTTLIYGRVGYAGGNFQIKTTDSSLADITQTLAGIRYGLGIEKNIYKNWGLRFEYSHIVYQSSTVYKVDASSGFITQKQTVVIPQTNQFELGLVYQFL